MSFKSLIAVAILLVSVSAHSAVECEKVEGERGYRPKNALAKEIASKLNVKTCNGKRFKDVVKGLGETSNVPASATTYKDTAEVIASFKK